MEESFTEKVKGIIKKIPRGKVATYGQIAMLAGNPHAARQVVWILHSSSDKDNLPWHRVINKNGRISLKPGQGYEMQISMLSDEGVIFGKNDTINLGKFIWKPRRQS
jgi:methylated-DNA-protein-cysteine methyltransferase-like protein